MKKIYIKPQLETYQYMPEKGFAVSLALHNQTEDYVLIAGDDRNNQMVSDEITEYTDNQGEYEVGLWN